MAGRNILHGTGRLLEALRPIKVTIKWTKKYWLSFSLCMVITERWQQVLQLPKA